MSDGVFGKRIFGGLRNLIGRPAPEENKTPATPAPTREFEIDSAFTPPPNAAPVPVAEPVPYVATQRSPESEAAAAAFVATVRHLPLFSGTATQIVRSMGDEGASGRELARLIAADAGLVTHLLRIVNSPYFGFANRVVTVADALSVLGVNQVRRLVTASILQRPLMSYLHDSGAARTFWRHELLCASLARHLAMRRNADGDAAYMAGLMHDIGRLAMVIEYPEHTDLLLHAHGVDDLALEREVARFGFDHAQIGGALLALWGLPPQIAEASLQHADVSQPIDAIAGSVWQANRLAHEMSSEPDDQDIESPWMTPIGLSVAGRRAIVDEIRLLAADQ